MLLGFNQTIWFYKQPIDFRKQIDGLMFIIAEVLSADPVSGHLFIFRNRCANKLKMLWWDRNGFWMFYKRLEKGRFKLPAINDDSMVLTSNELNALLSGLDFQKASFLPEITATNFY